MIEKYLFDPPKEYRGTPFWSWNEKLTPDELKEQIAKMKKAHLGGAFMHARAGLTTEYMSKEWFDCIRACVDEGKRVGMDMWSYDEDGWPSGSSGGMIPQMGDEYRLKYIELSENGEGGEVIACYAVDGTSYRYLGKETSKLFDGERLYYIKLYINEYYVDILDPKVVKVFIDTTYERYKTELGDKLGNEMPGFFTDEPQYARSRVPYSFVLEERFKEEYGYDMLSGLICIFLKLDGCEGFRYDYWRMISELYTSSYAKQIYEWCEENGCKFTGHAMAEDSLMSQMLCTAGVMPMYEYMHTPGMDWLRRSISSPVIPKQVSSVAAQTGKKFVLSETYAMCGWDVSFEELKWIGEWQYLNGVSFMCQHLEGYTIKGCRKRDYPPSMFTQSPWWDDYSSFNDYFARLGKLIADGAECVDTLVIHPMHSGWIGYSSPSGDNSAIHASDVDFVRCLSVLTGNHVEFHLGDENIMARHASVEGGRLRVGLCTYSFVVIPACVTLDRTTYELLREFSRQGGTIFYYKSTPTMINGRADEDIKKLNEKMIPIDLNERTQKMLDSLGVRKLKIYDKNGECGDIHATKRIFEKMPVYFLANQSKDRAYDVTVTFEYDKCAMLYDPLENKTYAPKRRGGRLTLHFEPMQSYVFVIEDTERPAESAKVENKAYIELSSDWSCTPLSKNAMTLDYAEYRTVGEWSEPLPVLEVQRRLIDNRTVGEVEIRYTFVIDPMIPTDSLGKIELAHEYNGFEIFCNDKPVTANDDGYYIDRRIRTRDITPYIKDGINTLTFRGDFYQNENVYKVLFGQNVHETMLNKLTYDTEIESVYIIGDFSVRSLPFTYGLRRAMFCDGGFSISTPNRKMSGGNIVENGYPFFSGRIKLSQSVRCEASEMKKFIKLGLLGSSLCKLYVNGTLAKTMLWEDREADVTELLHTGDNLIEVELVISNRNLLGPHHHPDGEIYYVSPSSFAPHGNFSPDNWLERYCFVSEGLM